MTEIRNTEPTISGVTASRRSDGKQVISGYSAVFYRPDNPGTQYRLSDDVVERIRPTAFHRAIKENHDARALFNHDPDNLLGRVGSGTCKLSADKVGLKYEITIDPADPDHQRVLAKIKRGDLTGSSFAFRPTKVTWEDNKGADSVRWIEDLNLYDVGPVTYPAYEASTTCLRGGELDVILAERDRWPALKLRIAQLKLAQQQAFTNKNAAWLASL